MPSVHIPLTAPQKDMILMERMRPGSTNITFALGVPGASDSDIEAAVTAVVENHDALRMTLVRETSEMVVSENLDAEIITSDDPKAVLDLAMQPIALDAERPNLRVVVDDAAGARVLRVSIPHSMTDGHTTVLLYDELRQRLHGSGPSLQPETGVRGNYSEHAARICEMYDDPPESVVDFWAEQFGDLEAVPKERFLEGSDPGLVDIPIGTPQTLRRLRQRLNVTESVALLSLFAHLLGVIFDRQPVACRTAFLGRRSKREMGVVGPLFELPLLRLDAMGSVPAERRIQASVMQLLGSAQPRDVLLKQLPRGVRGALSRQVCIFQDNRHFFMGDDDHGFAADNRDLYLRYAGQHPPASDATDELTFVPVDDATLLGVAYPIRGEIVHGEGDPVVTLRVLATSIERERLLRAASAVQAMVRDLTSG